VVLAHVMSELLLDHVKAKEIGVDLSWLEPLVLGPFNEGPTNLGCIRGEVCEIRSNKVRSIKSRALEVRPKRSFCQLLMHCECGHRRLRCLTS
jgi:hypothetical protein